MRTVKHVATLFYYDGPQVIEFEDLIGGRYIAVMIPSEDQCDRYLVAGVQPDRLRKFRNGMIDLRDLLLERPVEEWFFCNTDGDLSLPLTLTEGIGRLSEMDFLPDAGFVIHDYAPTDLALSEARDRNNIILEFSVEPPESARGHRMRASSLAKFLTLVQSMVKHAYSAALRELTEVNRSKIDKEDSHLLDVVVPAMAGSFRVVFESAREPGLFGYNELERALRKIDELFAVVDEHEQVLEYLRNHKGHFAGTFLNVLKFIIENDTGLRYSWAQPEFEHSVNGRITEATAMPLLDLLTGVANLGSESISLLGMLDEIDVTNSKWRLISDGKKYNGKVKDGGPSLIGLTAGVQYKFDCLEELEEVDGTGKERRSLYLVGYTLLHTA